MKQTICDQCGRVVSKAMTGFRLVTVDDEPVGADLCGARCLNDWVQTKYPVKRPDFEGTRRDLLDRRDEAAMLGAYDNPDDVEAALPYNPPGVPFNGARRNHALASADVAVVLSKHAS